LNSWLLSLIVFVCLSGGACLGMRLRARLPAHHLDDGTKDVVRVAMGLVATMAALVLGLLVASAKSTYDDAISEFNKISADLVLLDASLAQYGTETKDARDLLGRTATALLGRTWVQKASQAPKLDDQQTTWQGRELYRKIQELVPQNDMQRRLQAQALDICQSLGSMRWLLAAQQEGTAIPMPFMLILIFWLAALFASFGLFAPANATAIVAVELCALSVSTAILLILELARPFNGIIQISSAPLRDAIAQLGQ
jgi:hypothetical protein